MCNLRVERLFQVLQNGTSGNDTTLKVVDAEPFQRPHLEVLEEFLVGCLFSKHPVVEFEGTESGAEIAFEVMASLSVVEHLLRLEVANEFLDVVVGAFTDEVFARRDIEEADAAGAFSEVYGTEEVVLLVVQHGVLHGNARSHQFGDASLDEFLRQLRVFQLVADGDASSCAYEFRQVGIQCVMRESRHLVAFDTCTVVAVRQRDAENLCCHDGIVAVSLIEVATAEQQQRLRVFGLEVEELLHHGCEVFLWHGLRTESYDLN